MMLSAGVSCIVRLSFSFYLYFLGLCVFNDDVNALPECATLREFSHTVTLKVVDAIWQGVGCWLLGVGVYRADASGGSLLVAEIHAADFGQCDGGTLRTVGSDEIASTIAEVQPYGGQRKQQCKNPLSSHNLP